MRQAPRADSKQRFQHFRRLRRRCSQASPSVNSIEAAIQSTPASHATIVCFLLSPSCAESPRLIPTSCYAYGNEQEISRPGSDFIDCGAPGFVRFSTNSTFHKFTKFYCRPPPAALETLARDCLAMKLTSLGMIGQAYNKPVPEEQVHAESAKVGTSASASRRITASIRAFLFLLLCYTTVTVWVRQAWALQCFQIGIYSLIVVQIIRGWRHGRENIAEGVIPLLVYLIPLWGLLQIVLYTTTSTFETRGEVLRWGALSGVFYLSQTVTPNRADQQKLLNATVSVATALAVLCLMQLNTSGGRILWIFTTSFGDIYGTFQNQNNYAQFVEVALPIALWGAVREGRRCWWYALAGGVLYASAVSVASRAGFVLCTGELIAILTIGLARFRRSNVQLSTRSVVLTILIVPLVAGAFTLAVGWKRTLDRFNDKDPFAIRREYFLGAVEMAKHRPLTGYGLGTYVQVYQKYSIKDFYPFYANHVHNDWAEFAADGGVPFLALVSIPFICAIPLACRHPWGLGLVATMLSACVDYPFPRPAVSGWMFAILAMLYMTREYARKEQLAGEGSDATGSAPEKKASTYSIGGHSTFGNSMAKQQLHLDQTIENLDRGRFI